MFHPPQPVLYDDRRDAGRALAKAIAEARIQDINQAVVLALPRGGVPVGFEVARAAGLPLDVLAVRKLGAPGQPELALGAVASDGTLVLNEAIVRSFHLGPERLQALVEDERRAMAIHERLWRGSRAPVEVERRPVILVDDGLATGATMRAAARSVKGRASRVVVAVPVGAASTCRALEVEADQVICAATPWPMEAVGQFYRHFEQTTDEEVWRLLEEAARRPPEGAA